MPFDQAELPETSRILLRAADLIRKYGHTKGTYRDTDGFCILGSVMHICQELRRDWTNIYANTISRLPDPDDFVLSVWNDAKDRTAEDVINLLEETAFDQTELYAATETRQAA